MGAQAAQILTATQPFGVPVIIYLALAGAAAGTAIISSLFALSSHPDRDLIGSRGFFTAAAIIFVGGLFLIFDLESPWDWTLILSTFNPASWISWGARIIVLFGLISIVAWVFHRSQNEQNKQNKTDGTDRLAGHPIITGLTLLAGIAVAVYPACVLQQFTARPLWGSRLIVPLFLTSALHAGLAVLACVGKGLTERGLYGLGMWFLEVGLVLAQAIFVLAYLFDTSGVVSGAGAFLTRGNTAGYLWVGAIIGWLVPLALFTASRKHIAMRVLRTGCVLLGMVCLRAWLVIAGQDVSMLIGM